MVMEEEESPLLPMVQASSTIDSKKISESPASKPKETSARKRKFLSLASIFEQDTSFRRKLKRLNPLAAKSIFAGQPDHPVTQLFVDLHREEAHTIYSFIQNVQKTASHHSSVSPELDILLTRKDVTNSCVPATLCVFSTESGLHPKVDLNVLVESLKTTTKKRSSYWMKFSVDKKGIRFTNNPRTVHELYVISNGYCIQFEFEGEAKEGIITLRWRRTTDYVHFQLVGNLQGLHELLTPPETYIMIPLRKGQQMQVAQQLLRRFCPESLLLLSSRQNKVHLRDDHMTENWSLQASTLQPVDLPSPRPHRVQIAILGLVARDEILYQTVYRISQQRFKLPLEVIQESPRSESCITITVAFPSKSFGLSTGTHNFHYSPDVFAQFPSKMKSGFPFLVSADFMCSQSEDYVLVDFRNIWNKSILEYIPTAFQEAFETLLLCKSSCGIWEGELDCSVNVDAQTILRRDPYDYIPVKCVEQSIHDVNVDMVKDLEHIQDLEKVRIRLVDNLKTRNVILVSARVGHLLPRTPGSFFCKAKMGRTLRSLFRDILESAREEGVIASSILASGSSPFYIVDGDVQRRFSKTLKVLGVPHMTWPEYVEIIQETDWLMRLSERVYNKLLEFLHSFASLPLLNVLSNAVAMSFSNLCTSPAQELSLSGVARLYSFLHMCGWKAGNASKVDTDIMIKLWIPPDSCKRSSPSWRGALDCVCHDEGNLFADSVTSLDSFYDSIVLSFFTDSLNVPKHPQVEKYFKLWMQWSSNSQAPGKMDPLISSDTCLHVWGRICSEWSECTAVLRAHFLRIARVPTRTNAAGNDGVRDMIALLTPSMNTHFSEDPELCQTFLKLSKARGTCAQLAWVPTAPQPWIESLHKIYASMGLRNLSQGQLDDLSHPDHGVSRLQPTMLGFQANSANVVSSCSHGSSFERHPGSENPPHQVANLGWWNHDV